jgi:uncharacterized protein (TIGR02996 family)
MNEDEQLLQTILAAEPPAAWEAMLIYADWLEERGISEAVGWRALAIRKLWPKRCITGGDLQHGVRYHWEESITVYQSIGEDRHLPTDGDVGRLEIILHVGVRHLTRAHSEGWQIILPGHSRLYARPFSEPRRAGFGSF